MDNPTPQKSISSGMLMAFLVVLVFGLGWFLGLTRGNGAPVAANSLQSTTTTTTADVAAAVNLQPHFTIVNIRAENGKFSPNAFAVKSGKTLLINLTAVDGTYDFGFADPKIGFDVIVKKGETQSFGFDTTGKEPGNYVFHCIQDCPASGPMQGTMTIQ